MESLIKVIIQIDIKVYQNKIRKNNNHSKAMD